MARTRKSMVQRKASILRAQGVDLSQYVLGEPGHCVECDAVRVLLKEQREKQREEKGKDAE